MSIAVNRPLHAFDHDSIRPGVVGSVGDVLGTIKLKHSTPQLPIRVERLPITDGSNVQNGDILSYTSRGGPARVYDSNWQSGRAFKTNHGWYYQDLRTEDRRFEPFMGSTPQYNWRNRVANVYDAFVTGDNFLPLPGGYRPSPNEIERGQIVPVVDAIEPGEALASDSANDINQLTYQVGGSSNIQSGYIRPRYLPPRFRPNVQVAQQRFGFMNRR